MNRRASPALRSNFQINVGTAQQLCRMQLSSALLESCTTLCTIEFSDLWPSAGVAHTRSRFAVCETAQPLIGPHECLLSEVNRVLLLRCGNFGF
jgi:hypothetical protein